LKSLSDLYVVGLNPGAGRGDITVEVLSFFPTHAMQAYFVVTVDQRVVYRSSLSDEGSWLDSMLRFNISALHQNSSLIVFSVATIDDVGKESLLGYLSLTMDALLMGAPSTSSFLMTKLNGSMSDSVLVLRTLISHSSWDLLSPSTHSDSAMIRRITVLAGVHLAEVNGSAPNVCCCVYHGSEERLESPVAASSLSPQWLNCFTDLSLDFNTHMDVSIRL
jgi:hypothetical protein